jgi:hypothetical protein
MKKEIFNRDFIKYLLILLLIVFLFVVSSLLDIKTVFPLENQQISKQEIALQNPPKTQKSSECSESWFCTDWSDCRDGLQNRGCLDLNKCTTTFKKPAAQQTC